MIKLSDIVKRIQKDIEEHGDLWVQSYSITDEYAKSAYTSMNKETHKKMTLKEFQKKCLELKSKNQ